MTQHENVVGFDIRWLDLNFCVFQLRYDQFDEVKGRYGCAVCCIIEKALASCLNIIDFIPLKRLIEIRTETDEQDD